MVVAVQAEGASVRQTTKTSGCMVTRWRQESSWTIVVFHGSRSMRCGNPFLLITRLVDARPQTPSHIHTVYRPSDPTNKLIAKKIRQESNELEIFKLLDAAQPKSDHVITLVDSFQGQSAKWAILPKMESVADCVKFAPKELERNVVQVCLGLVKGLGYLHKLCIAHRDIKPGNLLVDHGFRLKVIDFDIAMRVEDEDEEVDDQCGTKGWIAPEVEKRVTYSPIRADRWSCGHVLLYLLDRFRKDDISLRAIAGELHSDDPRQRPSLVKSCSTFSRPFSEVADIRDTDGRKSSRSREVSMEIDGENTIPLKAKKQKLDVLGLGQDENSERHDYSCYREVTPVY
jgi:serine/threonine protein kinase